MFCNRLEGILNQRHELYRLSGLIDWGVFEREFGKTCSEEGRPGILIRLLVGLPYLSHALNTSDVEKVRRWVENPCHQYFCGEETSGMSCRSIRLRWAVGGNGQVSGDRNFS